MKLELTVKVDINENVHTHVSNLEVSVFIALNDATGFNRNN